MLPTSEEFINAMRANAVTTSARIDIINNEYNSGILIESGNYSIFEGEGVELDGSRCTISERLLNAYTPLIDVSENETQTEGWYSTELSDNEGNINITNAYMKNVKNSKQNISDLHILFSNVRNEYAVDFTISINGTTTEYTNNTENEIVIEDVTTLSDVVISIAKWSKPYSRAKILNTYLGTVFQYEDADIISIAGKKGVDLTHEENPSKEIEIKLVDENNTYNIFDENTELASLDSDARIIIYMGVLIENFIYYVKLDECYFGRIEKQDNELEMTIIGIGIISKYQDLAWVQALDATTIDLQSIEQIKERITQKTPKLGERIKISESLSNQGNITRMFEQPEKSVLDFIGNFILPKKANVVETYDNRILLENIKEKEPCAIIDLNNMEQYPEIKKNKSNYNILVKRYEYTSEDEKYFKFERFPLGGTTVIKLPSSAGDKLIDVSEYTFKLTIYTQSGGGIYRVITGNEEEIGVHVYEDRIEVFSSEEYLSKKAKLEINLKLLDFSSFDVKKTNDSTISEEKIIDTRTILDPTDALIVANWISENISKKYEYKIKANDACTYELGDTVQLETGIYQGSEMINKNAIIVGIEYEYRGYLDYYLTLKGA